MKPRARQLTFALVSAASLALVVSLTPARAAEPAKTKPAKPSIQSSAPIKNFRLPGFDKAGKRTTFLRAGEALIVSENRIDITDLHLTLFSADGAGRIDTQLTSPAATALIEDQVVSGPSTVRFLRDDLEVTGEKWSYSHKEKRVLIENNARVLFRGELNDVIN